MMRTIVIRRDYLHYIRKYNRFEKRHKNISAHCSPCFRLVLHFIKQTNKQIPIKKKLKYCIILIYLFFKKNWKN